MWDDRRSCSWLGSPSLWLGDGKQSCLNIVLSVVAILHQYMFQYLTNVCSNILLCLFFENNIAIWLNISSILKVVAHVMITAIYGMITKITTPLQVNHYYHHCQYCHHHCQYCQHHNQKAARKFHLYFYNIWDCVTYRHSNWGVSFKSEDETIHDYIISLSLYLK